MRDQFQDYSSGDFQFSNPYSCVSSGRHMKSISSTGCCKFCGDNRIYFISNKYSKGKIRWDDVIEKANDY